MSNTKFVCDYCGSSEGVSSYQAQNSYRGMVVMVCSDCGLVQSLEQGAEKLQFRQTLSSDADWGNVRHGKGARFRAALNYLDGVIDWSSLKNVLDVGSNRGDFVMWLADENPSAQFIHAVEPDSKVVDEYKDNAAISLELARIENLQLKEDFYDFIYNSHSLEHATSGMGMLKQMFDSLKPGGFAFVEVPNLDAIADTNIVEEYFIDKHTFHFDRKILINMVKDLGFEIVKGENDTDLLNLTLLLQKPADPQVKTQVTGVDSGHARRNIDLINGYKEVLAANRALLKKIVDEKLKPLAERQKVAYWGAGRIFDALVKYGELPPESIHCLVDKFLYKLMDRSAGVSIKRPEVIKDDPPHVVVVLGRSSEDEIVQQVNKFGVRWTLKFSDLIEQVR